MFSFIKQALQKIYTGITSRLSGLFSKKVINEETLKELELILISADTGVDTTRMVIKELENQYKKGLLDQGDSLREALQAILCTILEKPSIEQRDYAISLLVGINGSGKTTCASKLAYRYKQMGKRVLLVAADTFRAAAVDQLVNWAEKVGVDIETGINGQDSASVVFKGCERFITGGYDHLIIDTAGRLHTKANLMHELSKIKRVIEKKLANQHIHTILTIDSMLGQNSLEQAKLFKESTHVSSIILTKMDGTGKGGIVFAIAHELEIPIEFMSFGEQVDQIKEFDKNEYVKNLLQ